MGPVNFAVQVPERDHWSPRFNRRVVLKAAAILASFGSAASIDPLADSDPVIAAEGQTVGYDWFEEQELGAVGAASLDGPTVIETRFPYTAVGAHWNGDSGDWPVVELQISYDGVSWSDPFTLTASQDEGPPNRDGRRFTGLVCANGASYIAYSISDGAGNRVTLPGFALTYIDSSSGPTLESVGGVGAASTDPYRPPRIITRGEWGANESYRFEDYGEWWFPKYRTVLKAIVHHTEDSNVEEPMSAIRAVQYYHAVTRGWHDIGYNFLVDRYGNIYQGRVGGQDCVGGHAYEFAYGSSGIAFMGNHNFADVSSSALAGMVAIVSWALRFRDPHGSGDFQGIDDLPNICGHRDVLNTSCPGDLAYDELDDIRDMVAEALAIQPGGPPAGLVVGDFIVTGSDVNLRSSPGLSGSIIRQLSGGVDGVVYGGPQLANGSAWYQIATDYATGWAVADFLDLNPPVNGWKPGRFGSEAVVKLIDDANLRQLPSVSASQIATLPAGAPALVLGGPEEADANRWYKLRTAYGIGWAAARFLTPSNQAAPPAPPEVAVGETVAVKSDYINVRANPGTSSAIVGTITQGTVGTLTDGPKSASGYTWFFIKTSSISGWVAGQLLQKSSAAPPSARFSAGDSVVVDDGPLNLRSSASTSATILATLATGATGSVIDGPQSGSGYTWYRLSTASGNGWVVGSYLALSSTPGGRFEVGDSIAVSDGPLNLRGSAGTSSTIVAQLPTGATGQVVDGPAAASGYTWYRLETSAGSGWAVQDFLDLVSTPPGGGGEFNLNDDTVVADGPLNMRSSASTSASIVAKLEDGARCVIKDGPVSAGGYDWYKVSSGGVLGWVAGSFLDHGPRVGSSVRVWTGNGSIRLRSAAGTSSSIVTSIADGTTGTVLAGPQSLDGYTWWRIQTSAGTGWAAGAFLLPA